MKKPVFLCSICEPSVFLLPWVIVGQPLEKWGIRRGCMRVSIAYSLFWYLSTNRAQEQLNICLNICCIMTAKTITIREDIYKMLLSLKGTNESFSNFFERLVKSRSNIDKIKELRGTVEFRNKEALLKELLENRKETRY